MLYCARKICNITNTGFLFGRGQLENKKGSFLGVVQSEQIQDPAYNSAGFLCFKLYQKERKE